MYETNKSMVEAMAPYTALTKEQIRDAIRAMRIATIQSLIEGKSIRIFPGLLIQSRWHDEETIRFLDPKKNVTYTVPGHFRPKAVLNKRFKTMIRDAYFKKIGYIKPQENSEENLDDLGENMDAELDAMYDEEDLWV